MLTDPSSASNCLGWMRMQGRVCEFQQGLSWPINPCKKKSDFSLTPRVTEISGPGVLAFALAPSHTWKGVQRHSPLEGCVTSFPHTVYSTVPKHGLLNKPATPMGTMSSKQNNHRANPKYGTESIRAGSQSSSLAVPDHAPGFGIFVFSEVNKKTFFSIVKH